MILQDIQLTRAEAHCYETYIEFLNHMQDMAKGLHEEDARVFKIGVQNHLDPHYIKPMIDYSLFAYGRKHPDFDLDAIWILPPFSTINFNQEQVLRAFGREIESPLLHHLRACILAKAQNGDIEGLTDLVVPMHMNHHLTILVIHFNDASRKAQIYYQDSYGQKLSKAYENELKSLMRLLFYNPQNPQCFIKQESIQQQRTSTLRYSYHDVHNCAFYAALNAVSLLTTGTLREVEAYSRLNDTFYQQTMSQQRYQLVYLLRMSGFTKVHHSPDLANYNQNSEPQPQPQPYFSRSLNRPKRANLTLGYLALGVWSFIEMLGWGPLLKVIGGLNAYSPMFVTGPIIAFYPLISFGLMGLFCYKAILEFNQAIKNWSDNKTPESIPPECDIPKFNASFNPEYNLEFNSKYNHSPYAGFRPRPTTPPLARGQSMPQPIPQPVPRPVPQRQPMQRDVHAQPYGKREPMDERTKRKEQIYREYLEKQQRKAAGPKSAPLSNSKNSQNKQPKQGYK